MKELFTLEQLVQYIREHSRFYNHHLKYLPPQGFTLNDIPVIDASDYWAGSHDLKQWPVLTATVEDGLLFKTGGTTSVGKLAVYTHDEWQTLVTAFGENLSSQLNNGDRVANLFFAGDLCASFLFIHDSLAHVRVAISEFPFTGHVDFQGLTAAISDHRINVLSGVPAQLLKYAAYLTEQGRVLDGVATLLYGGESVFAGQLAIFAKVFPNARVASIGYASVDAGLIGSCDRDCALGEHRVFDHHTVLEIIDELSGEIIDECNRVGLLVVTNLNRRLMPLLRYPVGDRACWLEPAETPRRKFALRGRSVHSQRVRVGVMSLLTDEIHDIIQRMTHSDQWQLRIEQVEYKDLLSVHWVPEDGARNIEAQSLALRQALIAHYPAIDLLDQDGLLDFQVSPCAITDLALHPRSGKQLRVLDLRVYTPVPEAGP
ncbi:phenylacetate--CoA ligase family protein [Pseudomonas sp. ADAK2]|uniref:phenylacetate--CoA ligase family protein n=1 Tax=unclassified Pseudomonas TaxID=196821 RepID=UPI001462C686|nr:MULTISPECIES: phenylacetate--CoA ligase family protein [unclassified Pseudomonas]QJI40384.1 phenylacetate--CoA ligase family protein [Pseudomonas sp. ADAK7]QJI46689.1 phenylacetate--CoA ligase family protein [Pseudomonas sp. ADAK2]